MNETGGRLEKVEKQMEANFGEAEKILNTVGKALEKHLGTQQKELVKITQRVKGLEDYKQLDKDVEHVEEEVMFSKK